MLLHARPAFDLELLGAYVTVQRAAEASAAAFSFPPMQPEASQSPSKQLPDLLHT